MHYTDTHLYVHIKCPSNAECNNLLTDWLGLLEGKNMIAKAAACSLEASGLKFHHKICPLFHQKGTNNMSILVKSLIGAGATAEPGGSSQ